MRDIATLHYDATPDAQAAMQPAVPDLIQATFGLDGYTVGQTIMNETLRFAEAMGGEELSSSILAGLDAKTGLNISPAVYASLDASWPGATQQIQANIAQSLRATRESLEAKKPKGFLDRLLNAA